MLPTAGTDPFVGRTREMAELTTALDNALAGRGRLVMLVGEPGIGKTRTAEELATIAAGCGAEVLWGRCPEERGAPPYWPWVQIIRSHITTSDANITRSELGPGASVVAEVVSDIRGFWPDLETPVPIDDPDAARFRLFDAISSFLRRMSQSRPVILILDNLHWSDEASLRFLEFVAQELAEIPMLIVGTYRDVEIARGHPLFRALGDLTRQRLFSRVLLRGLDEEEVGQLISARAGLEPPTQLAQRIHLQTEGNPLFVEEMIHLMSSEGIFRDEAFAPPDQWKFRLPEGVREVIGRRLDMLSQRANDVLTVGAVIGRRFELRQIAAAAEVESKMDLLEVLEEAVNARIIHELPDGADQYEFTHALVQQTIAAELSATQTVRMHARVATALEQLYVDEANDHAQELFEHFVQAETVLGIEPVIRYATIAGSRALDAVDPASALIYLEAGVEAFGDNVPDERLADLLAGLGRAQVSTLERAEMQTAIDNVTRAFDIYIQLENEEAAIRAAMTPMWSVHGPTGRADLIERALALVEESSEEQARLLTEFGLWVSHERGDYEMAKEAFSRALQFANRTDTRWLQLRIHNSACPVHTWNLNAEGGIESARAAIRLSQELDDPGSAVDSHAWNGWHHLGGGDWQSARNSGEECARAAERTRNVFLWTSAMWFNAEIAMAVGDWRNTKDFLEQGRARAPLETRLLLSLVWMEYRLGDFESAIKHLETIQTQGGTRMNMPAALLFALGSIHGAITEIPPEAEQTASEVLAASDTEPLARRMAAETLAHVAVATSNRDLSAVAFREATRMGTPPNYMFFTGGLMPRAGWIAGLYEEAGTQFENHCSFYAEAGYRPLWAESCGFYAESLLERREAGDEAKAAKLIVDALRVAEELDMRPLAARLEYLSEQIDTTPPEYPDALSKREVEVLRLIAAGWSNQKIADELFISRWTVIRHVTHIFSKTGAHNRAEAAVYAERQGLSDRDTPGNGQ